MQEAQKKLAEEFAEAGYDALTKEEEGEEMQEVEAAVREAEKGAEKAADRQTWAEARARTESLERNKLKERAREAADPERMAQPTAVTRPGPDPEDIQE